ncbi:UhpC, Sugar phosphate permease [Pyrenophora tritici-repentis]|uniref:MFS transporter n=1 Tax=Pyrenophora tritici-repentis TaxID=45151 RepID=A0A2W1H232_9PLEO|nr:MFS transporter [Pyrenophora tritici-repentis]KAI0586913.1 MFS transporter [Pyrenophora tritici-repentis]KAI1518400.1 MFS transporter [Pyrenophora tritici-repentis]PZD43199.1 UhpC, Sugar phosphate permease [Pyrenophora tritici-repentis]
MVSETKDAPAAASSTSGSDIEVLTGVVNEKKLMRKLDLRLLPAVSILYLLSFLDRSNVANARIEGLTKDLNMTGNQYLTGLTLYFIGYVLFELPCNIILKRTTPKFWLPTLTLAWGVVATLMGVTQNREGFFAVRFFLGVTESGLFPGVVYYLSMWYKRNERQYRISLFFSCASLAGAFGGILAYGIAHMRNVGGYAGWRWIFILEGLFTILVAIIAYWFISNYPDTVSWLSKDERAFIQARLKADSDATNEEAFLWSEVLIAAKDVKVWLYAFAFHTMSLPLYTLSLFLPTIIRDMGYTSAQSQLLTIPPYAVATLFTIFWAILSERYARRALFILATTTVAIIGYIILLANTDPKARPGISYLGTFFAAVGIYPSVALVLCWPAINVSGQTKRATANAMQISIGNLGAVLGTQLYRANSGPRYVLGHSFALGYCCLNLVVVGALLVLLKKENREKDKVLLERPETGGFHDSVEDLKMGDRHPRWRFQV